jgi:hypothetical protein
MVSVSLISTSVAGRVAVTAGLFIAVGVVEVLAPQAVISRMPIRTIKLKEKIIFFIYAPCGCFSKQE